MQQMPKKSFVFPNLFLKILMGENSPISFKSWMQQELCFISLDKIQTFVFVILMMSLIYYLKYISDAQLGKKRKDEEISLTDRHKFRIIWQTFICIQGNKLNKTIKWIF